MSKNVKIFIISIGFLLFVIIVLIGIRLTIPVPFADSNEVAEEDWNDNWEKDYKPSQTTNFVHYSNAMYCYSNRYIITNFAHKAEIAMKSLTIIDSIKATKNDSSIYFKFLWNDKYNHDWRVEYVNQKYVDEIASLFDIHLVYPEKSSSYLLDEIHLYPALEKKHKKIHFSIDGNKLITNYTNGFDFFMWKDLQDTTKVLYQKKQIDTFVLINKLSNKKIAIIRWRENGYRIFF